MATDLLQEKMYWQESPEEILQKMQTNPSGLEEKEILARQKQYGLNTIHKKNVNLLTLFIRQFTSNPLIIILAVATFASYLLGQHISSYYIFGMIILSVFLG